MATAPAALMTAEEFFDWCGLPENRDRKFELVRGVPVEVGREEGEDVSRPCDQHGTICAWIGYLFFGFAVRRGRGRVASNDTGILVGRDPDEVRGPDLMFFDESRPAARLSRRFTDRVPALAVEVLSPSDEWSEVHTRVRQLLRAGVPAVWVVDPAAETVMVFRAGTEADFLEGNDELVGPGDIADFRCRVADLFALPGV